MNHHIYTVAFFSYYTNTIHQATVMVASSDSYAPNEVAAAVHYLEEFQPRIRKELPDDIYQQGMNYLKDILADQDCHISVMR